MDYIFLLIATLAAFLIGAWIALIFCRRHMAADNTKRVNANTTMDTRKQRKAPSVPTEYSEADNTETPDAPDQTPESITTGDKTFQDISAETEPGNSSNPGTGWSETDVDCIIDGEDPTQRIRAMMAGQDNRYKDVLREKLEHRCNNPESQSAQ